MKDWRIRDKRLVLQSLVNRKRIKENYEQRLMNDMDVMRVIRKHMKETKLPVLAATNDLIKKVRSGELVL